MDLMLHCLPITHCIVPFYSTHPILKLKWMGLDHLFSISSFYFTEGGASLKRKVRTAMVSSHFFFYFLLLGGLCEKRNFSYSRTKQPHVTLSRWSFTKLAIFVTSAMAPTPKTHGKYILIRFDTKMSFIVRVYKTYLYDNVSLHFWADSQNCKVHSL